MEERNKDIKDKIKSKKNLRSWMVAEKLGILDNSFSRMLRYPLTDEKRAEILEAIDKAAEEL
jgi:hypothetical protein